ncbi:MAG: hypothetical protein QOG80_3261 [Pseudonocardiales bacterium]|nr:hypothetical protein [Pseudonocardiales bacterium]
MTADLTLAMSEFQRCIAERDLAGADAILDADYALELVHPVAAVVPRDRWLAALPDYVVHSYDVEEQIVDVDVDVAVVLHRALMRATVSGVDRSGVFIVSDVWRLRDGRWRIWMRHSTPVSAGPMPSA